MHPHIGKHIAPWFFDRKLSLDLELDPFEQDAGDADATVPPLEAVQCTAELFLEVHVGLNTSVQVDSHLIAQAQ
jgi:hypothetical protein